MTRQAASSREDRTAVARREVARRLGAEGAHVIIHGQDLERGPGFLLTGLLLPRLRSSAPARIVTSLRSRSARAGRPSPTRALASRQDRMFPLDFQRRIARERLGIEVDVTDGGHMVALSNPAELASRLEAYRLAVHG